MQKDLVLLGFDVGGTKLGIGLGTSSGRILDGWRMANVNTRPEEVLPRIAAEARRMVEKQGLRMEDVAAFGISAPFPADAKRGIMLDPPNNPLWRNVPILEYLSDALKIPGAFENDANSAALAEWFFGAGKGCENMVYLTMSTGIGGGIIASGRLIRGGAALSAGEIGHLCVQVGGRKCSCGQEGCYEAYCGGRAVALRMREELSGKPESMIMRLAGGDPEKVDMIVLEKAVRANDPYALALWDEIALRNAQAMGMLINMLNPEKLILGTLAWAVGDLYTDPVKKYLPRFCWKEPREACAIVSSALKREISSCAGIAAALNYLNESEGPAGRGE
ncbi:MAG: ROK family protein [Lentisphaeria bacterium]|nr:ROK family protein [Lentisphaeria bacterium]